MVDLLDFPVLRFCIEPRAPFVMFRTLSSSLIFCRDSNPNTDRFCTGLFHIPALDLGWLHISRNSKPRKLGSLIKKSQAFLLGCKRQRTIEVDLPTTSLQTVPSRSAEA